MAASRNVFSPHPVALEKWRSPNFEKMQFQLFVMLLLYASFQRPLSPELFHTYLNQIPKPWQDKALRYMRWSDIYTNLFGKILLKEGIHILGLKDMALSDIEYSAYGKPLLKGMYFNISHSDYFVGCLICESSPVGLDVEIINESLDLEHFKNVFSKSEWDEIQYSSEPFKIFYKFWTIKESVIKGDGRGLSALPLLSDIQSSNKVMINNQDTWYFKDFQLQSKFQITAACNRPIGSISLMEIKF